MKKKQKMVDRSGVFCFSNNEGREVGPLLFFIYSLCMQLCSLLTFQDKYKMENIFQELILCKWPAWSVGVLRYY